MYWSTAFSTVTPQNHGTMSFSKMFTNRFFESLNIVLRDLPIRKIPNAEAEQF